LQGDVVANRWCEGHRERQRKIRRADAGALIEYTTRLNVLFQAPCIPARQ
jgi:hypothetical protein